jgi:hypothetical protein
LSIIALSNNVTTMKNGKSSKKYDIAKATAIKNTARKMGCTENWVRKIENGDHENEEILKEYRAEYKRIQDALNPQPQTA